MTKPPKTKLTDDPMFQIKNHWSEKLRKQLLGKTIIGVRYLTTEEMQEIGWYKSPVVIELNDGQTLFPQKDDEGNDGGALYISRPPKGGEDIAPTIY
tara:strand:+ start:166 stop:456 length:291 start_codon:yes stop_codon:yes gene_type:complete